MSKVQYAVIWECQELVLDFTTWLHSQLCKKKNRCTIRCFINWGVHMFSWVFNPWFYMGIKLGNHTYECIDFLMIMEWVVSTTMDKSGLVQIVFKFFYRTDLYLRVWSKNLIWVYSEGRRLQELKQVRIYILIYMQFFHENLNISLSLNMQNEDSLTY